MSISLGFFGGKLTVLRLNSLKTAQAQKYGRRLTYMGLTSSFGELAQVARDLVMNNRKAEGRRGKELAEGRATKAGMVKWRNHILARRSRMQPV